MPITPWTPWHLYVALAAPRCRSRVEAVVAQPGVRRRLLRIGGLRQAAWSSCSGAQRRALASRPIPRSAHRRDPVAGTARRVLPGTVAELATDSCRPSESWWSTMRAPIGHRCVARSLGCDVHRFERSEGQGQPRSTTRSTECRPRTHCCSTTIHAIGGARHPDLAAVRGRPATRVAFHVLPDRRDRNGARGSTRFSDASSATSTARAWRSASASTTRRSRSSCVSGAVGALPHRAISTRSTTSTTKRIPRRRTCSARWSTCSTASASCSRTSRSGPWRRGHWGAVAAAANVPAGTRASTTSSRTCVQRAVPASGTALAAALHEMALQPRTPLRQRPAESVVDVRARVRRRDSVAGCSVIYLALSRVRDLSVVGRAGAGDSAPRADRGAPLLSDLRRDQHPAPNVSLLTWLWSLRDRYDAAAEWAEGSESHETMAECSRRGDGARGVRSAGIHVAELVGGQARYWVFSDHNDLRDVLAYWVPGPFHVQLEYWDFLDGNSDDQFRPEIELHLHDRRRRLHDPLPARTAPGARLDQHRPDPHNHLVGRVMVSPITADDGTLVVNSLSADFYWKEWNFASLDVIRDPATGRPLGGADARAARQRGERLGAGHRRAAGMAGRSTSNAWVRLGSGAAYNRYDFAACHRQHHHCRLHEVALRIPAEVSHLRDAGRRGRVRAPTSDLKVRPSCGACALPRRLRHPWLPLALDAPSGPPVGAPPDTVRLHAGTRRNRRRQARGNQDGGQPRLKHLGGCRALYLAAECSCGISSVPGARCLLSRFDVTAARSSHHVGA